MENSQDHFYTFTKTGFKKVTQIDLSNDPTQVENPSLLTITQDGKQISYKKYQALWQTMMDVTLTHTGDEQNMSHTNAIKLTGSDFYKKIYLYKNN
jgi:hypothetical protein